MLTIQDLGGTYRASDDAEIESIMLKRYGEGVNAFRLYRANAPYPGMLVLVRDDLATLHFFPEDQHPGFRSLGSVEHLDPLGSTSFFMNRLTQREVVQNDAVVLFSAALAAAKEFSATAELPKAVDWLEL